MALHQHDAKSVQPGLTTRSGEQRLATGSVPWSGLLAPASVAEFGSVKHHYISLLKSGDIEFRRLPFDDLFWQVALCARRVNVSAALDCYIDAGELRALGRRFADFTGQAGSEASFELGNRSGTYTPYTLLRAYSYDAVGHSALEFVGSNFSQPPYLAEASFSILYEVAGINRLGAQLCRWTDDSIEPLLWIARSA